MNIHDYIEKLRAKPVHERKRIAVIGTAIGFAIILAIWVVSFNEMNKTAEVQPDQTSASVNDLKNNFQAGKDSIQNMMEQLPSQTGAVGTDSSNPPANGDGLNTGDNLSNSGDNSVPNPGNIPNATDNLQNANNNSGGQQAPPDKPAQNNMGSQNDQQKPGVPQLP